MNSLAKKRRIELKKELERILNIFTSEYNPSKIILFGSLANNTVQETSDIDILVIKDTNKRYWDRIDEVLHLVHPQEAIDIFVLTNKEVKDNLKKDNVYLREILDRGKVLYERANK